LENKDEIMTRYPAGSRGRLRHTASRGVLVLSGIALSASVACAETWTVVEGDKGAIHGIWQVTIDGSAITGSAAMLGPKGKPLTYHLGGEIRDGKFVAHRVEPSDRSSCTYVVEMGRSDKLAGSALCGGTSYPWHVTRTGKR
jgi:hypothetical protein